MEGLSLLTQPTNCRLKIPNTDRKAPFVVIEGIDASGKTLHTEPVLQELTRLGYPVQSLIFPNSRTPLGRFLKYQIHQVNSNNPWLQHILFSLHRWELMPWLLQTLAAGVAVVCERHAWSGAVHSAASEPDVALKALMFCDQGILKPDLVVFLKTSVEESRRRRREVPTQADDRETQDRVWNGFHEEVLWKDVRKIEHHTRTNLHESQSHLRKLLREILKNPGPCPSLESVMGGDGTMPGMSGNVEY